MIDLRNIGTQYKDAVADAHIRQPSAQCRRQVVRILLLVGVHGSLPRPIRSINTLFKIRPPRRICGHETARMQLPAILVWAHGR